MVPDHDDHGVSLFFLRHSPNVYRSGQGTGILASPIVASYPLIAMIFTHIFLQQLERVTLRMVLGAILVAVGMTFVVLGQAS